MKPDTKWLRPLTGLLDNRSPADLMPPGSFRRRLNFSAEDPNKLIRSYGWQRLFARQEGYNDLDLHDQLLSLQSSDNLGVGRQPITMLFQAVSSYPTRRIIAGTESRLYVNYERGGAWRIIGEGFGEGIDDGTCPRRRFQTTQNQDVLLFSNNYDPPEYWAFDSPDTTAAPIDDLVTLNVRKAGCLWTWNNVTFMADVTIGHQRYGNRIIWSDYQDPLSWDPGKIDTIASFQDLDDGETILGGKPLGDYFVILTDRKIWLISPNAASDQPFTFVKRNPTQEGSGCLFYRNTLCLAHPEGAAGQSSVLFFCGRDGLYTFTLYQESPNRADWLHVASKTMFDDLDPAWCDNHIAEFDASTKTVNLFWVPRGSETGFPTRGLKIDPVTNVVTELDYGCTALVNAESDMTESLGDALARNCVCQHADMVALIESGASWIAGLRPKLLNNKTNLSSVVHDTPCPTISPLPQPIIARRLMQYNPDTKEFQAVDDAHPDWDTYEDGLNVYGGDPWTTPDADSICSLWVMDDCLPCRPGAIFIGALSDDWCLKQFVTGIYYRETCTNPEAVGTGSGQAGYTAAAGLYSLTGYTSRLMSGAQHYEERNYEKRIREFLLDAVARAQAVPSRIRLYVGVASQPVDPLQDGDCLIQWFEQGTTRPQYLKCQTAATANGRTRPNEKIGWPVYRKGYFLYYELVIEGTGGGVTMSGIGQRVELATDNNLMGS